MAPVAKKIPVERTHHGDTVIDEYSWLLNKDDPDTIAYLEAENAYTQEMTAHLKDLQDTVFQEIKSRTLETDLSVPTRKRLVVLRPYGRGQTVRHPVPGGRRRRQSARAEAG